MDKIISFFNMLLIALASAFGGGDSLEIIAPKTTLRAGETVQIKVIKELSDGTRVDVTHMNSGTKYSTTDYYALVYEPDGRVTAIDLEPIGSDTRYVEDVRKPFLLVFHGDLYTDQRFKVIKNEGPGPSLEVKVSKQRFRKDESIQLKVSKRLPDGTVKDLTSTSTGTKSFVA